MTKKAFEKIEAGLKDAIEMTARAVIKGGYDREGGHFKEDAVPVNNAGGGQIAGVDGNPAK